MESNLPNIAANYDQLATQNRLDAFSVAASSLGATVNSDFVYLYEQHFARLGSWGRPFYDRIKLSARGRICPYCGQLPVRTVDHYLPKETFGSLSVMTKNLVPCCNQCNFIKSSYAPADEASQLFHPYFDDFDDAKWLGAKVAYTNGVAIEFFVEQIQHWLPTKQSRAQAHFDLFELAVLFATQAGEELTNLKYRLEKLYEAGGAELVQDQLVEDASSRRNHFINSWQTAMYEAIAADSDFHDQGFLQI